MSAPALAVSGLSYVYPDGTPALREVSFQVEAGAAIGLVGPSGAGKSTLLFLLVGLLPLQAGSIKVQELELSPRTLKAIRERIGLIFQNPDDQLFMPTLFEDVAFGLVNLGVNGNQLEARVKKALAEKGLAGLEEKFPGHLSAGQKRLATLAGVLVMEPQILLLDEPTSNLDPRARRQLLQELATFPHTKLIASHDLEMILDLCDRVLLLSQGKIVAEGDPQILLADPELMTQHGLEVPHSLLPSPHQHQRRKTKGCE